METWRVVDNVASISFEILRAYHSKYHSIKCIKIVNSTHNNPQLFSLSSWGLNFPPFPHDVVSMLKRTSKVPPFPTLTSFHCLNGHRIYRHFSWRSLNAQVDIKSPINVGLSVGDLRRVVGKTCRCWLGSDDDTTLPSPTPQVLPSPTDLSFLFPTPWNNGTPTHM